MTAKDFAESAVHDDGRFLGWAIFRRFPELKKYYRAERHAFLFSEIKSFVRGQYAKHRRTMAKDMRKYGEIWRSKEAGFYELTGKLFPGRRWPKGEYIAYGTIWGMFPRFLENKTFQVPFHREKKYNIPVIVAHEMLHFMFYDYLYGRYPKYKDQEKYSFFVWHVSEVFNSVVQNTKEWKSFFGGTSSPYPEHRRIVAQVRREIGDGPLTDIDRLTDAIIRNVKATIKS